MGGAVAQWHYCSFIQSQVTMSTYHVKCIFDSQIPSFNFLGSLEIPVDLRACLWKQVSQCLENKGGKCSDWQWFTHDCSHREGQAPDPTCVSPEGPWAVLEDQRGRLVAITLDSGTVCRSNHQLLVDQGLVGLSLGLVTPDEFFKIYQPFLPSLSPVWTIWASLGIIIWEDPSSGLSKC